MKLFDVVPYNFFQIFSGNNRIIYADILFMIHEKVEEENSYSFEKTELLDLIEDYFNSNDQSFVIEDEQVERKSTNARENATHVLRKLKQYGWIDSEYGMDQKQYIDFEDYAVAILKTFTKLNDTNRIELGSSVYRIYENISSFNLDKGYMILQETVNLGKDLIVNLKTLSANIRKYMKTLLKMNTTDEEKMKQILDQLLGDYKENVIDQAYFYMKTKENPIHYKRLFLQKLNELQEEELVSRYLITQIMDIKNVTEEEAEQELNDLYNELENLFPTVIDIMREIDRKNSKYIASSIERIRIIINHDINLEGKLIEVLKGISNNFDFDTGIYLNSSKMINKDSLYQPRSKKTIKEIEEFKEITPPSIEDENLWDEKIKRNSEFSKKAIRKYVDSLLKEKEEVTTSDIQLDTMDDILKIYLIFIYSNSEDRNYEIVWKENMIKRNNKEIKGIELPDFIIKKRC